ncbi:MAG: F0F1 ATP synthase subunit B [Candidatus Berkelbacteria bacterium]
MESLGIDIKLLIAQAVNFLIVMFLLWKFAYNPVLKMLDERKSKIEKGLSDAKASEESLGLAEKKAKEIKNEALSSAADIIKEARTAASAELAAQLAKANEMSARIIENATKEATTLKSKVLTEAKKEISGLIVASLDKIVGDKLTTVQKEKLAEKRLQEIQN